MQGGIIDKFMPMPVSAVVAHLLQSCGGADRGSASRIDEQTASKSASAASAEVGAVSADRRTADRGPG